MTLFEWGLVGVGILLLLMFLNIPIGFAMALVGFFGMWLVRGMNPALALLANEPYSVASHYVYSVIPFFIFLGNLASHTRLSADAFFTLDKWLGHFRGGLAMGTMGTCAIFAAVCSDPISCAATTCNISLAEMRKYQYNDQLSLGTIAAGGNLGFLIPPSLVFIIYGLLTEQSIGVLFMSGIVPGIMLTIIYMITINLICRINPQMASSRPAVSWKERIAGTRKVFGVLIVIVLILGGIYAGIFTPTEAGAVGVFGIIIVALAGKYLTWKGFTGAITETASMLGMIFILVIGAMIFSRFLVITEVPMGMVNFIAGLNVPRLVVLIAFLIIYAIIGCLMDIMSIVIVATPILHPVLVGLGFDPVWVAVLTVITVLMGNISPPFGIVVFALAGMVPDVPLYTIFRGIMPFLAATIIGLAILVAFPEIALWLPHMMRPV
jgi:C4-dicarboxylate transporter DctM subunit